jgi:hypothetical protein
VLSEDRGGVYDLHEDKVIDMGQWLCCQIGDNGKAPPEFDEVYDLYEEVLRSGRYQKLNRIEIKSDQVYRDEVTTTWNYLLDS